MVTKMLVCHFCFKSQNISSSKYLHYQFDIITNHGIQRKCVSKLWFPVIKRCNLKSVMLILEVFGMKCLTDKWINISLHFLLTSHYILNANRLLRFPICHWRKKFKPSSPEIMSLFFFFSPFLCHYSQSLTENMLLLGLYWLYRYFFL